MEAVRAWLLKISSTDQLAIGEHELVEILAHPQTHHIPKTPAHCRQVIIWRGLFLPLLRPALLTGRNDDTGEQPVFTAVIAFQENPDTPLKYGALTLAEVPVSIQVEPGPAIEPPALSNTIRNELPLSCFRYDGSAILVFDMKKLFNLPPIRL